MYVCRWVCRACKGRTSVARGPVSPVPAESPHMGKGTPLTSTMVGCAVYQLLEYGEYGDSVSLEPRLVLHKTGHASTRYPRSHS